MCTIKFESWYKRREQATITARARPQVQNMFFTYKRNGWRKPIYLKLINLKGIGVGKAMLNVPPRKPFAFHNTLHVAEIRKKKKT